MLRLSLPDPLPPSGGTTRSSKLWNLFRDNAGQTPEPLEILNVLRRHWRIILACICIITAISAAVVLQITPRYTAESSVVLDTRKTQVVDVEAVVSRLPAETAVIHSEAEILRSPTIAEKVAKKFDLTSNPEFNPRLRPASMLEPLHEGVRTLLTNIGSLIGLTRADTMVDLDPAQTDLLEATRLLQRQTDVVNDGRSYVLKIRVESENPRLAASLANAYADLYLQAQLEAKFDAVRRANEWLNEQLADLRNQVQAADRAVEAFRAQHHLTQAKGETVTTQQLSELNSQLIIAAADRAQKESSLRQIQEQLSSGDVDAAGQVLASPLIQQLRKQETDLLQQEAQLATRYKPAHPAMINAKAQERDLQKKIENEINKIVQGVAGEVVAARAREASLRDGLVRLQKSSAKQGATEVQLRELERQADSTRMLYENFLSRFKETSAQGDIQQADARLVATARVPKLPSYPRIGMLIGIAFVGSTLLGICTAFGVERLDIAFRTGEQLEKFAQVTSLGMTPALKSRHLPYSAVVKNPTSPYSEAIRMIRAALRYSDIDNPPKVVLVTSSLVNEGKSVTALSLARSVACSGGKALLIDCDLRRPSIGKALSLQRGKGIPSLFEPAPDIRAAIQVDPSSGMHFICSTGGTSNPPDLLGSNQLRVIIDELRADYDMIVLDTPPVLAVSDAYILSHIADTTIFLVRWGQTPRRVVLGALRSFRLNGGNLAGVILSRVDLRRHAMYGYGDSGYFYGRYGKQYYGGYVERSAMARRWPVFFGIALLSLLFLITAVAPALQ